MTERTADLEVLPDCPQCEAELVEWHAHTGEDDRFFFCTSCIEFYGEDLELGTVDPPTPDDHDWEDFQEYA